MKKSKFFNHPTSVFATVIGTVLDSYDMMLFAHFLFILIPLFFPPGESASWMGFATFAIGTIFRPLGGTLFGHLGDRWGRRETLVLTLFLSAFPTCFIGLLPSYAQIGVTATVLLIIFRILQNVSISGEAIGACCILLEQAKVGYRGLASGLSNSCFTMGGVFATLIGYVCTKYLPEWGWRVPFLFASLLGFIGFYVRYNTLETPIFKKIHEEQKIEKIPLLNALKHNWREILCTFGFCAAVMAPAPTLYVYLGDILKNKVHLEASQVMIINAGIMFFAVLCMLFFGWLSDRIGPRIIMLTSTILFSLSVYPIFKFINSNMTAQNIIIAQLIIKFLSGGIMGPINVVINFMYPPGRRFSGWGFSWGVGSVIFSGFSPLICKFLENYTGDPSSPGLFLMVCGIMGFLGTYFARHYQERIDSQVGVRFDKVEDSLDYMKSERKVKG